MLLLLLLFFFLMEKFKKCHGLEGYIVESKQHLITQTQKSFKCVK